MDAVYMVAAQEVPYWEELRFSLRSVEGMFDRVWLVGAKPPWVQDVLWLEVPELEYRFPSLCRKVSTFAAADLSDEFVLLDCDMVNLGGGGGLERWVEDLDVQAEVIRRGRSPGDPRRRRLEMSLDVLKVLNLPRPWLTMENHWPQLLRRDVLRVVLAWLKSEGIPSWYYLPVYATMLGGVQVPDVKIYDGPLPQRGGWVSLDDWSWESEAGQEVRRLFTTPSSKEVAKTP